MLAFWVCLYIKHVIKIRTLHPRKQFDKFHWVGLIHTGHWCHSQRCIPKECSYKLRRGHFGSHCSASELLLIVHSISFHYKIKLWMVVEFQKVALVHDWLFMHGLIGVLCGIFLRYILLEFEDSLSLEILYLRLWTFGNCFSAISAAN